MVEGEFLRIIMTGISVNDLKNNDWLNDAATQKVMGVLNADNIDNARFVGGCVRNAFIGAPVDDIDVATILMPEEVIERCENAGIAVVPTGLKHGTVTAIWRKKTFEITTLRRDVETDGRHAVVLYTDDWKMDAARRDFTMNALYLDKDGFIHDFFNGVEDVKKQHVRFIGDPHMRISEDVLRIFRFFRFSLYYGSGQLDETGLQACRDLAHLIPNLSVERIKKELFKIASHRDAIPMLNVMGKEAVLAAFFSALFTDECSANYHQRSLEKDLDDAAITVFLASYDMHHFNKDTALDWTNELFHLFKLSAAEKHIMRDFAKAYDALGSLAIKDVKKQAYMFGKRPALQAALWRAITDNDYVSFDDVYHELQHWDVPEFPLHGQDLIDAGIKPGKAMGARLKQVEKWWLENDMSANKETCLDYALKQI